MTNIIKKLYKAATKYAVLYVPLTEEEIAEKDRMTQSMERWEREHRRSEP